MDASFDTRVPVGFDGDVYALAVQNDGKIIVGGEFTTYQWIPAKGIIRLNADGTKDYSFDIWEWFNGRIRSLVIQSDGKIIAGWWFTQYNGLATDGGIISLNTDGTKDNSFNSWVWFDGDVYTIAIQNDGKLIVGGYFTSYQWITAKKIVRLNANGTRDGSFNIWTEFGDYGTVTSVAIQNDGKILVGEDSANGIVRLNDDWSKDTSFMVWNWLNWWYASSLLLQNDWKIIVGGNFTTYSWASAHCIVRLNTDGTKDNSFNSWDGFGGGYINILTSQNDWKIIVGGNFATYSWSTVNGIIRLNTDWDKDAGFSAWVWQYTDIRAIVIQNDWKVIAGGHRIDYNWVFSSIIREDTDGTVDTSFIIWEWFNGNVRALMRQSDEKIIVGGDFTSYDGIKSERLVRLNIDESRDMSFDIWNWFNNSVNTIALQNDGKIIVGGRFTTYQWLQANGIIRLNSDWSRDNTFNMGDGFSYNNFWEGFYSEIQKILIQNDGKIIVGGNFTTYSWSTARGIVRLNADGTKDTSFNSSNWFNRYDIVYDLLLQNDGKLIVGGAFETYSWVAINNIVRINTDGSRDSSFTIWNGFNASVSTLALQNDWKVVAGGYFTSYQWVTANRIIRLNIDGSKDTSFIIWDWLGANAPRTIAVQNDGKILIGWGFDTYDWITANYIVRLNATWATDSSFDIWESFNASVGIISIQNDGKILVWGWFTRYNGVAAGYLVALYGESDFVMLPNSTDTGTVVNEFVSKWYVQSDGELNWSKAISLIETDGVIPLTLNLKNRNIKLTIPANVQFKKMDDVTNYDGIISVPVTRSVKSVNDETTLSAFKVGGSSESLRLEWGMASLSILAPGKEIWDLVQVYYSEDNGVTWYPQVMTAVTNYEWQPYVEFTTNHFTNFAITIPSITWSFVINDDDAATTSLDVNLTMFTTPSATYTRFSNDNITRSDWGTYTTSTGRVLSTWNWTKTVYVEFDFNGDHISDVSVSDNITYIDTIAPTIPTLSTPTDNSVISTSSWDFSRNAATDTGGISGYLYQVSIDSWFTNLAFSGASTTTGVSLTGFIDGIYYRRVAAYDTASNTGLWSSWWNFTITEYGNGIVETWEVWASNWGWGISLTRDLCPINRDCSSSYYDSLCGRCSNISTTGTSQTGDITNSRYSTELNTAYQRAFSIGITTMPTIQQANLDDKVIREHLAKMITQFAIKVLKKTPNTKLSCSFSDITDESAEMKFYIKTSCQLGLMGRESDWKSTKKNFDPIGIITRAQFATTLSRLLYGTKYNSSDSDLWYSAHLQKLHTAGIINDISNPAMGELRGYLMLMLQRTQK